MFLFFGMFSKNVEKPWTNISYKKEEFNKENKNQLWLRKWKSTKKNQETFALYAWRKTTGQANKKNRACLRNFKKKTCKEDFIKNINLHTKKISQNLGILRNGRRSKIHMGSRNIRIATYWRHLLSQAVYVLTTFCKY